MEPRIPKNVIKDLRESIGMTQLELAEAANVTRQRIIREEQFISVEPSDSVLRALSEKLDIDPLVISRDYRHARERLHTHFYEDLTTSPFYSSRLQDAFLYALDYYDAVSGVRSPTMMFREYLFEHYGLPSSAIKFCQFTGMHPATLSDIETGKTDWDGASALIVILMRLKMGEGTIDQLGTLHDNYFLRRV